MVIETQLWEKTRFKFDNSKRYTEGELTHSISRELLLNSVKINEYLSPQISSIIDEIQQVLGVKSRINLYVKSNPMINAYYYGSTKGEINILLTSALVNIMTFDELKFIIAHECSHALFEHHKPLNEVIDPEAKRFLNNACEISCDRLAHSIVDHPVSSYSALLKIESGLSQDKLNLNVREYLLEYKNVKSDDFVFIDNQTTHPFINTRVRALLRYETSDLYYEIKGYSQPAPSMIDRIDVKIADDIIRNGFARLDLIEKDHQDKMLFWSDFMFVLNHSLGRQKFVEKYGVDRFEMGLRVYQAEGVEGIERRVIEKQELLKNAVYLF